MNIITHRGLEPSEGNFFPESSYEAFENQLSRGYSIEFDPNFISDDIVVSHDSNLKRITNGKEDRDLENLSIDEIKNIRYGNDKTGSIPSLTEIFELLSRHKDRTHAMHLKGKFQKEPYTIWLAKILSKYLHIVDQILVFDLKPEVASVLKKAIPSIHLASSVSHKYDVERYGQVTGGTLLTPEEAVGFRHLYDWVWLDEWDLTDRDKKTKTLYNRDVFSFLRSHGYKIALVTPELHGTSPGLLGGESHPDASSKERLFRRIEEVISLSPDAICTDYPEEVKAMYLAR